MSGEPLAEAEAPPIQLVAEVPALAEEAKEPRRVDDMHPFDRPGISEIPVPAHQEVSSCHDGVSDWIVILAVTLDLWERLGETWHVVDHRAHELDRITRGLSRNGSGEIRSLDELPVQFLRAARGKEQTILTVKSGVYHSARRGGRPR